MTLNSWLWRFRGPMFDWIYKWYVDREIQKEREALPAMNWEDFVERHKKLIGDRPINLETRNGGTIAIREAEQFNRDFAIVGVCISCLTAGMEPWDSEEPAKELAQQLATETSLQAIVLIGRDPNTIIGYFVRVRPMTSE